MPLCSFALIGWPRCDSYSVTTAPRAGSQTTKRTGVAKSNQDCANKNGSLCDTTQRTPSGITSLSTLHQRTERPLQYTTADNLGAAGQALIHGSELLESRLDDTIGSSDEGISANKHSKHSATGYMHLSRYNEEAAAPPTAAASAAVAASPAKRPSGSLAYTSCPSGSLDIPSRRRSTAAHATITPLSVQRRAGGTTICHAAGFLSSHRAWFRQQEGERVKQGL